ncbi:MoaF C-terminal domain-containing protein [Agromyces archimandritae]|uniref:MoaF N-terminal domain-containing protein n=1 Tax=Agromyces archimandritae TaxID=2781962 RepID=A0A975FPN1_9MICO|nr:MoaF C-terminal domain-containing protein [Agromyces archimandritae]QTX05368.1 MoaF N-terminal domain-containing protein [Agromyces archimandritae]
MTDTAPAPVKGEEDWHSYDEFAAGIDTYRLPPVSLDGRELTLTLDDGTRLDLAFGERTVTWSADGALDQPEAAVDPYDAVAVREDVHFVTLPFESRVRESLTVVIGASSNRAIVVHGRIDEEAREDVPQVSQRFWAATSSDGEASGEIPAPSRDLIGKRNVYRYSPEHLYEHVYVSSQRYAWQCLEGVQRGHGDMDLSTVWKFADGLYLFCFREFRIPVASVWLHDLGYGLMTTGNFLGLNGAGESEHSKAGGHIYPLGSVAYPDAQPV